MLRRIGDRKPSRDDKRTLRLRRYVSANLPKPPQSCDFTKKMTNVGPMLNAGDDPLGDCTIAGAGHLIQSWTAEAGHQFIVPDADILAGYEGACGYDPHDPSTDAGGDLLTVLKYWRTTGFAGHTIGAFAAVDPKNVLEMKQAIWLFGGLYMGADLPKYCEDDDTWDVAPFWRSRSYTAGVDGHCVPFLGYDKFGVLVDSWGDKIRASWPFVARYFSEAYAAISVDQLCDNKLTPAGFDNTQLTYDLVQVAA